MNNRYLEKAKKVIKDPKMLSIVSAKRAKQLAMGARPLSYCNSENYIDVALLEIAEGKITGEFGEIKKDEDIAEEEAVPGFLS
ncbi:MAG: DNA-directed RNA polymerase subunit omega [Victivallales bacterium]|nr:DNA-directed RNA polymerase subunit omega [Victivallales bacterium]